MDSVSEVVVVGFLINCRDDFRIFEDVTCGNVNDFFVSIDPSIVSFLSPAIKEAYSPF